MNITASAAAALLVLVSACGSVTNDAHLDATTFPTIPAGSLNCTFNQGNHAPYSLKGKVSPKGLFTVELVTGGIEPQIVATGIVDNHRILPATAKDGSTLLYVSARTDDPDFGDTFTIKLPKKVQRGHLPATIEHVYYSRDPMPAHVLKGQCTLN